MRNDLKSAIRLLYKSPVFTGVAVLTLALGIGLNSSIFSLIDAVLLRPLQVDHADRIERIYSQVPDGFLSHEPMAYPDVMSVAERTDVFDSVAGYAMTQLALQATDEARLVIGEVVTGNYFETLGVSAHRGRLFGEQDDRRGAASPVAVLSYASWIRHFGGDESVIGREVVLNGHKTTIVAVVEKSYRGLMPAFVPEIWIPLQLGEQIGSSPMQGSGSASADIPRLENRDRRWVWTLGRRAQGVSQEQAGAALVQIAQGLAETYPDSNKDRSLVAMPLRSVKYIPGMVDAGVRTASWVLMGLVTLVLLISSANLASMLLARAVVRRREIATRLSLGASRLALMRQLLIESLVLALLGGVVGLAIAWVFARLLAAVQLPAVIPLEVATRLDLRVVLFTLIVSTVAALAFGLAPAFDATRTSLANTLREEGSSTSGTRRRRRFQGALVIAQVALSTVLLVCAALSMRSAFNAERLETGFNADGAVVAQLDPALQGIEDDRIAPFYDALESDLSGRPGVQQVAWASHLPLTLYINTWNVAAEGQDHRPQKEWADVDTARISDGYFAAMGIDLVEGRDFEPVELDGERNVVIVNQELARRFWPEESAIGKRVRFSEEGEYRTVIGIARDGRYRTLGEAQRPHLYSPLHPEASSRFVILRHFNPNDDAISDSSQASATALLREVIREHDPHLAIQALTPLRESAAATMALPRLGALFFGLFGVLGLLISVVGLYGLLAYNVSQRTQEIGIRVALGADQAQLIRMVLRQGIKLTLVGLALGLGAALVAGRTLVAILYGITPYDPATFLAVSIVLLAVTVVACLLPARRAVRIDPMKALRLS